MFLVVARALGVVGPPSALRATRMRPLAALVPGEMATSWSIAPSIAMYCLHFPLKSNSVFHRITEFWGLEENLKVI